MTTPPHQSYREIHLTKGQVALVDAEDFERINAHKWYAKWSDFTRTHYAARNETLPGGKRITVRMHREVMGVGYKDPTEIDHRKTERTLDNRKENLRAATKSENGANSRIRRRNRTGFKGVYPHGKNKWSAKIVVHRRPIYLGDRDSPQAAHVLYCEAALKYRGEYARTR